MLIYTCNRVAKLGEFGVIVQSLCHCCQVTTAQLALLPPGLKSCVDYHLGLGGGMDCVLEVGQVEQKYILFYWIISSLTQVAAEFEMYQSQRSVLTVCKGGNDVNKLISSFLYSMFEFCQRTTHFDKHIYLNKYGPLDKLKTYLTEKCAIGRIVASTYKACQERFHLFMQDQRKYRVTTIVRQTWI